MSMSAKRFGFLLLTAMLAICCMLLTLATLYGLYSAFVPYADKGVLFIPLAYPAYVFFKWTRESHRIASTWAS